MCADQTVLRPMTAADIEPLRALARDIWQRHYVPIIGSAQVEYMLAQRYRPEVLRAELDRRDLWWDLLLVAGEPQGYSSYFVDEDGRSLKLDKLYVHPDRQHAGHGARMLARVLERARALGCARLRLAVNKRNANAIAAYRKWQFRVEEAVVKDIGGGFVMDDYIMVRDV
jgi:GNAT superfamily N-acetyltransferase